MPVTVWPIFFWIPLPCGAHTTASDALWGGCPVLTCMGSTFPGRVAASLLIHMGLPQLVATNLKDYERLAMTRGQNHRQRQQIRHHLHQQIASSPIFNGRIFAQHLERGFLEAWTRHVQHLPPPPFTSEGENAIDGYLRRMFMDQVPKTTSRTVSNPRNKMDTMNARSNPITGSR